MFITKEQFDELIRYKSNDIPILSFYLSTDPSIYHREEFMKNAKTLIRQTKENIDTNAYSRSAKFSLLEDLDKIMNYVESISEHTYKTLAIFSSSKNDFFQSYELNDNFKDMIVIDYLPYTKPLFTYLKMVKRYLTILVENGKIKTFEIFGNNISEELDMFKRIKYPNRENRYIFTNEKKYYNRIETEYRRFLRESSDEILQLFMSKEADFVIIGGDKSASSDLFETLHPYIKERFIDYINVDFNAKDREILEKVTGINQVIVNKIEQDIINSIKAELAKDGKAKKGIKDVLNALTMAAVQLLTVEEGYILPGFMHKNNGYLFVNKNDYNGNPEDLIPISDIINETIDEAINQGADVRIVKEKSKMYGLDHIAALLRFKIPE